MFHADALAEHIAAAHAPALVDAVRARDADRVAAILRPLDRRDLYALAIVLADQAPADELAARLRDLDAERVRPVPPAPAHGTRATPDQLAALLDEATGHHDDPGRGQSVTERRMEDYAFCRSTGDTVEMAAARVGISEQTARKKYEPHYRKGQTAA